VETPTQVDVRDDAELIRAFLARRDVACPGCGYNLRGLAGTRCPECEREITLGVSRSEQGRWRGPAVVLLGAILLALGVQIVLWLVGVGLAAGFPPLLRLSMFVLLGAMVAESVVLARLIVALRQRVETAAGWGLWWLGVHAAALWASVVVNLLVL